MSKNFYIADLHDGHERILDLDHRPFATVEEQRQALIKNWNAAVDTGDTVYVLGDESWHSPNSQEYISFFEQLKGHKVLVRGNHSAHKQSFTKVIQQKCGFVNIADYLEVKDEGRQVVLSHYPILAYKNSYYGAYHLYGHVHMTYEWKLMEAHKQKVIEEIGRPFNAFNVGAMMPYINYTPRTLDEILRANDIFE